jgi:hypothetical protein
MDSQQFCNFYNIIRFHPAQHKKMFEMGLPTPDLAKTGAELGKIILLVRLAEKSPCKGDIHNGSHIHMPRMRYEYMDVS